MFHAALILSIIFAPVYLVFGEAGMKVVIDGLFYVLDNPLMGTVYIICFALAMKYLNIAIKSFIYKKKKVSTL